MPSFSPFTIEKDTNGQWFWRITAKNGNILGNGRGYNTRRNAQTGLKAVLRLINQYPKVKNG